MEFLACRVLLVEDSEPDAELVVDYLSTAGPTSYEVFRAARLDEACRLAASHCFDVALLDLRLPDGNGQDCVQALQQQAPRVPIVVLTGVDDEETALECIAAGAQDYLTKNELHPRALSRAIAYAQARSAETAAREHAAALRALLAAIVDASADAIVSVDMRGTVTSWNHGAERMFGYSTAEATGQAIDTLVVAETGEASAEQRSALAQARLGIGIDTVREVVRHRRDGTAMSLAIVITALRDSRDRIVGLALTMRDVTESKHHAEQLRLSNARLRERSRQMRALTTRMNAVREEERTSISREVHDQIGQQLTGIKLDIAWIRRRLAADGTLADNVVGKLNEAEALVDSTIGSVQRIAIELRPSALDSLGLVSAVRDEARRFSERSGVGVEVWVEGKVQPPTQVATAFFRILQELLTNVARHAQARNVLITLRGHDRDWLMEVRDDGRGIEADVATRREALGLLGMSERAAAVGGRFHIAPAPDHGTLARITVTHEPSTT